jgi:hypothetical protein
MEDHRLVSGDRWFEKVVRFCDEGNKNLNFKNGGKSLTSCSSDYIRYDLKTNSAPWS